MKLTRTDWDQILVSNHADERLEALQKDGALKSVFPALAALVGFGGGESGHKCLWSHTKQVVIQTVPQVIPRWCSLFHDVGKPTSYSTATGKIAFHGHEAAGAKIFRAVSRETRLFSDTETAEISFVIYHLGHIEAYELDWTDSAVRRVDKELGVHLETVFAVARADCTTARPEKRQKQLHRTADLKRRIEALRVVDAIPPALPKGLGDVLMQHLGLTPGKELGTILATLRTRVEAGELPRNAEAAIYLAALGRPV